MSTRAHLLLALVPALLLSAGSLGAKPRKVDPYKDGTVKSYYPSGELMSEYTYLNRSLDSPCLDYYKNGQMMYEWTYRKDKLHGVSRAFYMNGELMARWSYKRGVLHGKSHEFYPKGRLKSMAKFKNGQLLRRKEYNARGKLIRKEGYPKGKKWYFFFLF